ncbi:MAG: PKD domain-containing protein [Vicinamibacterales bacterium]
MRRTVALVVVSLACAALPLQGRGQDAQKKPSLALRARPTIAFAPARVTVTAEVRGGSDDYRAFYCPALEWEWGDGTRSEAESDCDPYEPGKSEIRRRYVAQHTFRQPGTFRVQLRLKQGRDVAGQAGVTISVRPGFPGDPSPEAR